MNKKLLFILLLVCFFVSGCGASGNMFLRKNQKDLGLKPNEGGVIFSFYSVGGANFKPHGITLQEVNQYKEYSQKKPKVIRLSKYSDYGNIYLLNMKLFKGTYRLASINCSLGFSPVYVPCIKVFDVVPGEINYIGRLGVSTLNQTFVYGQGYVYETSVEVNDFYEEDIPLFRSYYPILQGEKINKDLLY